MSNIYLMATILPKHRWDECADWGFRVTSASDV